MQTLRKIQQAMTAASAVAGLFLIWGLILPVAASGRDEHAGHDHGDAAADHGAAADSRKAEPDTHADGHAAHVEHAGEEDGGLRLTAEQRNRFGIAIRAAGPGSLRDEVRLQGEIAFNEDRVVHLAPRVAGIVRAVFKSIGDPVTAGEVMAALDSRELADARSECLAAKARSALAEKKFAREKMLREKQVSSEEDYLEAEQALEEARIALRAAEQKLHALGLTGSEAAALDAGDDAAITRCEIRSPLAGVVTEKHISPGESLAADADIFTVADISSVWVNLAVNIKDLDAVRPGREVALRAEHSGAQARGQIAMVTPFVEVSTRSATARVILDNRDGRWVPGTFVSGFIGVAGTDLPVVVPRRAVQQIEGRDVVFVEHDGGFEPIPVITGRSDRENVEVVSGLEPGTPYVAEGAFQLKAAVITSTLGSHAGHGH